LQALQLAIDILAPDYAGHADTASHSCITDYFHLAMRQQLPLTPLPISSPP